MNFFDFQESGGLAIGRNFWYFVATWLPLTFLTIAIYILVIWQRRKGASGQKAKPSQGKKLRRIEKLLRRAEQAHCHTPSVPLGSGSGQRLDEKVIDMV